MPKSMLIARSIQTSGPRQLILYDCQTRQRKERSVLIPTMAQLGAVGKVIRACPRNVAVGRKITKWVYLHHMKPVKHLKLKEATV